MSIISTLLFIFLSSAQAAKSPDVSPASKEQIALLKSVDDKYIAAETIVMDVKKTNKSGMIEQVQEAKGSLNIKKGKLRLDLETKDKDKSLVVADGSFLWMVTPPPKEFKDAKTQVLKAPLNTKQARSQGLLQVLTEGGVLKYFKPTGVKKEADGTVTYFLQPQTASQELRRLVVSLNSEDKTITQLRYWDSLDNETNYDFSKVKFNQKLDKKLFTYKPPKNADVITP